MKEDYFEMLKKCREKLLERKNQTEDMSAGIWYPVMIDGAVYPVLSCFPVSSESTSAEDKFKYLLGDEKC